jgi:hypothetical protein
LKALTILLDSGGPGHRLQPHRPARSLPPASDRPAHHTPRGN